MLSLSPLSWEFSSIHICTCTANCNSKTHAADGRTYHNASPYGGRGIYFIQQQTDTEAGAINTAQKQPILMTCNEWKLKLDSPFSQTDADEDQRIAEALNTQTHIYSHFITTFHVYLGLPAKCLKIFEAYWSGTVQTNAIHETLPTVSQHSWLHYT